MTGETQARMGGWRVETQLIDRDPTLEPAPDSLSWADARRQDGMPVEIKAAKYRLDSGRKGRFLIRRSSHEQLARQDGIYRFAVYRVRGQGAEILRTATTRARALRIGTWTNARQAGDRDAQAQLSISRVFG